LEVLGIDEKLKKLGVKMCTGFFRFQRRQTINLVAPWISIVRKCMAHKILRTALKLQCSKKCIYTLFTCFLKIKADRF
jgi:hypothetical protein